MKKKLIALALAIVAISAVVVAAWPRSIRLIGTDKLSPDGLSVSITRGNTWDNSTSNKDGIADFGRGIWRLPWDSRIRIIAVYDDKNVYWEGVVKPDWVGSFPLQLNDGRPKQVTETTQEAEQDVHGNTH